MMMKGSIQRLCQNNKVIFFSEVRNLGFNSEEKVHLCGALFCNLM
ncbi:hypothetical protein PLUTE_a2484 [Pseudoalteromonas luteoviolacea DSM 6061]|nr:hypothetical protein [Pseudoalteromonas luteoviolacea DSM 6061]